MSDEEDFDETVCPACQASLTEGDIVCAECGINLVTGDSAEPSSSGLGYLVAFVISISLIMLIGKVLGAF